MCEECMGRNGSGWKEWCMWGECEGVSDEEGEVEEVKSKVLTKLDIYLLYSARI